MEQILYLAYMIRLNANTELPFMGVGLEDTLKTKEIKNKDKKTLLQQEFVLNSESPFEVDPFEVDQKGE